MIKGIYVELKLGSQGYSPSNDPLYLGIFGKHGGREFALDSDNYQEFDSPNKLVKLQIGEGCCIHDNVHQVRYSSANDGNTPINYPIEIDDIEYVYLRKHQRDAESGSSDPIHNDNLLVISKSKILICDSNNKVRLFERNIDMFFGYESGVQHWLIEGEKPGCEFWISLGSVYYGGENIDRYGIDLKIEYSINNGPYKLLASRTGLTFRHGTSFKVDRYEADFYPGCCGNTYNIKLRAHVKDNDFLFANPQGNGEQSIEISCTPEREKTPFLIDVSVRDSKRKKTAIFNFKGDVYAKCV